MLEEYLGFNFNKNQFYINFNNKTVSWLFLDFDAIAGDGIYYSAVYYSIDPFIGYIQSITTTLQLKPILAFRNVHDLSKANLFANSSTPAPGGPMQRIV